MGWYDKIFVIKCKKSSTNSTFPNKSFPFKSQDDIQAANIIDTANQITAFAIDK